MVQMFPFKKNPLTQWLTVESSLPDLEGEALLGGNSKTVRPVRLMTGTISFLGPWDDAERCGSDCGSDAIGGAIDLWVVLLSFRQIEFGTGFWLSRPGLPGFFIRAERSPHANPMSWTARRAEFEPARIAIARYIGS